MRADASLALLAAAAGTLDAVAFMRFGPVLISAMTGNLALFGLAIGQLHLSDAMRSVAAFACFVAGVALGAAILNDARRGEWSPRTTIVFAGEALLLAAFALLWLATTELRGSATVYALIVLSACAMGLQSAVVRQLDGPGIATTFLTGTLTGMVMSLVSAAQPRQAPMKPLPDTLRQVCVLAAYTVGAVVAGLALLHGFRPIAALPLAAVLLVLGTADRS